MANAKRVLVLGGTTEASGLVHALANRATDFHIILSLAGRTRSPQLPSCEVRVGGFGGAAGLADYLNAGQIDLVVDATHPFAARMRWNAATACARASVPRLRVERPAWAPQPGDIWQSADSLGHAAKLLDGSQRIFLTIGRQELASFAHRTDKWFLVRAIDPPTLAPPLPGELLLARGPFSVKDEIDLMTSRSIDTVVSKNSGGSATEAKLGAARHLGIPVVMVERPPNPDGPRGETVADALNWLNQFVS